MGQVISFIFTSCFGGWRRAENKNPIQNEVYSPPPPSYYIDIVEEHNLNSNATALQNERQNNAATLEKKRRKLNNEATLENNVSSVTIIPQKPEETVYDPFVRDDLRQPLITPNSFVNTVGVGGNTNQQLLEIVVEETKELINDAEEATSSKAKKKKKSKEKKSPNSVVNTVCVGGNTNQQALEIVVEETKELINHAEEATSSKAKKKKSKEKNSPNSVVNTVGVGGNTNQQVPEIVVEETKEQINLAEEATSSKAKKKKTKSKGKKSQTKMEIVGKIGPYKNRQKILLVGEGDFSFSASLAVAFGNASNIVATSLNEKDFLLKNYEKAMDNIKKLESRGSLVIHCVDATKMADHELLSGMKFHRIIFNFPHTGFFNDTARNLRRSKTLVRGFLRNAKMMIDKEGEIHVTHKTSRAFIKWNIVELASKEGLYLTAEDPFHPRVYPGYDTKYGFGGDENFDCYPCKTYKFRLEG